MKRVLTNLLAQAWEGTNQVELVEAFAIFNPAVYCQYHHRRKAFFSKWQSTKFKKITELNGEPEVATATFGLRMLDQERIPEINEYFFFHGIYFKDETFLCCPLNMLLSLSNHLKTDFLSSVVGPKF